jgi:hypothetical protein
VLLGAKAYQEVARQLDAVASIRRGAPIVFCL